MNRGNEGYLVATMADGPHQAPSRWRRLLRLPRRLVDVVRVNRRAVPAVRIYVAAAVIGLAVGLTLYFTLDWVWWPFPLVTLLLTALVFATTAFTREPFRNRTVGELRAEVDRVFAPSRAEERRRAGYAVPFESSDLPLYGLPPEWSGLRYFGSSTDDGEAFTSLGLSHQPDGVYGPRLDVETHREPLERRGVAYESWLELSVDLAGEPDRDQVDWLPLTVRVDGVDVAFDLLIRGEHWWALGNADGHGVLLHGENYSPTGVRLLRVTDLEPYAAGQADMEQQLSEPPGS